MPTLVDEEEQKLRTLTEDELWDAAWKETWLALSAQCDKDGTQVDEKKAFSVAQELWGTWMLKRKKLEAEDDGPSLPVNDAPGLLSPKATRGDKMDALRSPEAPLSALSGLRAEAPEFTPVVSGERSMFQNFFSPDLLEGGLSQNPTSFTINPNLSVLLQGAAPGINNNAPTGRPVIQVQSNGKKGLLGDGAEYFRLEPGQQEGGSALLPTMEAEEEPTTQGWLPSGFSWVDIAEDETPPPPSFFELQLPATKSFVRSSKPTKIIRVDNVSSSASPSHLQELFAQFGPVLDFYAMGMAKLQMACRLYISFENEAVAAAAKKQLHGKTHSLSVDALQVEFGRLEPKTRTQREKRERRRGGQKSEKDDELTNWPMAWPAPFPGSLPQYANAVGGQNFPDLALSFMPHPVFPEAPQV
jgi:hypothetical protein